jgi:hypothetical protein
MKTLLLIFLTTGLAFGQAPENEEVIPQSSAKAEADVETQAKDNLSNLKSMFSEKDLQMSEVIKTLKAQLNLNEIHDEMFSGNKSHLKGDPPEKPNGVEELTNIALAQFRVMNPRELEQLILEQTAGGPIHSFLASDYKSLSFVVKVMQHPRALPYLGRMLDQRHKFYIFLAVVVLSFIGLFIYKRKKFKGQSYFSTLIPRFVIFFLATVVRMLVLILLFHKELKPLYEVASAHFV